MVLQAMLKRNTYYDSIVLMSLAQKIKGLAGVEDVGAVMATEANRELLRQSHLFPEQFLAMQEKPPRAEDLLIVVRTVDERRAEEALHAAEEHLQRSGERGTTSSIASLPVRSVERAIQHDTSLNLAVISVPGEHAWLEAEQALHNGLHVLLFSDNVPVEQELRLKTLAVDKGLLLMGPDCGTAMINGVGLGFSNVVPRGPVGIVGASGTGMQQVMCLLAASGVGISQAIGTGGRDLSEAVGGIMMRHGLHLLARDPHTEVIVLVSKPPAERVASQILSAAELDKPVVVIFLGASSAAFPTVAHNISFARTLTEGAALATAIVRNEHTHTANTPMISQDDEAHFVRERKKLNPSQHYVRALYSGGTLCDEAMLLMSTRIGPIYSNIPLRPEWTLQGNSGYAGHTALDLGSDEFTRGRPHPMIDPTLRLQYLKEAAHDPQTAVILLDIVLGFCSHADPARIYASAIQEVRNSAIAFGRSLPVIVSLCGTEGDPQRLSTQRSMLEAAGAYVYESNARAAFAASMIVHGTDTIQSIHTDEA